MHYARCMDPEAEKLNAVAPFSFRPGQALAKKIGILQRQIARRGGVLSPTEAVRDGLLGCWPEVRTYLLIRHTSTPADSAAVSRIVAAAQKAIKRGFSVKQIEEAIGRKLP